MDRRRVLLVDDHPLVVAGLSPMLREMGYAVAEASDLSQAVALTRAETFDAWIVDLDLPDGSGARLLTEAAADGRRAPRCLVLSATTDPDEICMALDAGALAFVSKTCSLQQIATAIAQFLKLPDDPAESQVWDGQQAAFAPASRHFPRGSVLSPKEREVFLRLREGLSDKEIAAALGRSIHTVRVQLRSIRYKRGRFRRAEVA